MSSREATEEYIAFISYCHKPLDKSAAERIQKSIEGYRVPAELRDQAGGKRLGRVFRDEDELPAAPNLTAAIKYALDHSRFLITICTRSFPASRWCQEEVRYFLEHHDRDHVLAVLVDGDPEESFSKYMRYTYDEEGNITGEAEPLAANIAGGNKTIDNRVYRREITRLAAALIGCSFDALWQREKRSRTNRLMGLMGLGTAVLAAFLFLAVSKNNEITLQSQALMKQYNSMSVETGMTLLEKYDPYTALQIGGSLLLEDTQSETFDFRAMGLINKAMGSYCYRQLRSRILYTQETDFKDLEVTADGQRALVMDTAGTLRSLDLSTGDALWTVTSGALYDEPAANASFLPLEAKDLVLCRNGRKVCALSLADGREIWSWNFLDKSPAAVWALSPDGETLLVVSCQEAGAPALLTGLDTGTGEEKGSVDLSVEGYQMMLQEKDPAFSMGLGFSDDSSRIACAFYADREGEEESHTDCFYLDISVSDWEIIHRYVWERDEYADSAIFLGIKPDPEKEFTSCIQYDNVYGSMICTCMDWKKRDFWQASDAFRLRARSGIGLPSGMDKNYHSVPMLCDERMLVAFLDNGAFVYDRESGRLQNAYLFEGKILHARWLDKKERNAEILTDDGSICRYDFSSDFDFAPEEVELNTYDQYDLRLSVPVGQGILENREGFIYLTVRDEEPGQILGVERISDLTIQSLAGTAYPDVLALTPSGGKLMSWHLGETTRVSITDTGTGSLVQEASFDTPGEEARPFPLDEKSFLYRGKICFMDGSIKDLEVPEGYSLDNAREILHVRMEDGRVLTAANLCRDTLPHLNLCWINGSLVQASARRTRNLAFRTCTAFALGENGWYTGYGTCRTENAKGVEEISEKPCFGSFHAPSGKRVLIEDPKPDALRRTLAVGTREPVFACAYDDGSIAVGSLDTGRIVILDTVQISGDVRAMCFAEGDQYLIFLTSAGRLNMVKLQDGGLYFSQNVELFGRSASQITGISCLESTNLNSFLIRLECGSEAGGPWYQVHRKDFNIIGQADHVGAADSKNGRIYSCINRKIFAFPIHSLDDLRQMTRQPDY